MMSRKDIFEKEPQAGAADRPPPSPPPKQIQICILVQFVIFFRTKLDWIMRSILSKKSPQMNQSLYF
jgi:hypothetical protein